MALKQLWRRIAGPEHDPLDDLAMEYAHYCRETRLVAERDRRHAMACAGRPDGDSRKMPRRRR